MSVSASLNSKTFDTLYGTEKTGKIKIWNASVQENADRTATATIEYGQIDGKKQTTVRDYAEGKNIGRKNETTPYIQCLQETERKWTDKKEKEGYTTEMPNGDEDEDGDGDGNEDEKKDSVIFPMLAGKYEPQTAKKKRTDIQYPCFVQPKLDGLRCITYMKDKKDKKVVAQSRTGGIFDSVEHITTVLLPIFKAHPRVALDGELYTKDIPFETLAGIIKKKKITDADRELLKHVKYHIYDMIHLDNADMPYVDRHQFICKALHTYPNPFLEIVRTDKVKSVDEFKEKFGEFVANDYEGIMLRNIDSVYKQGFRSNDLQKYKEFHEEEYSIVGFDQGDGRDKGTVIWKCQTKEGRVFSVRPRGTHEHRQNLFKNGDSYVGKQLTVIFQELSELNVPRFPVGKAVRDNY
jgi:ATP-dependent DNA ligase